MARNLLRDARTLSGLTQAALAARSGTSQATLSDYERGAKQPSTATLARILAAAGWRLTIEPSQPVRVPSRAELEGAGAGLVDVLALAEALPARHDPILRYPRLGSVR